MQAAPRRLVVPLVRTRDDTTLPLSTYAIRINGIEAGRGEAPPGHVLVLTDGSDAPVPGRPTVEPVLKNGGLSGNH